MKGSTLHRSGLTKENMGILAGLSQISNKKTQNTKSQIAQYHKTLKSHELDILWNAPQKEAQKVHNATRAIQQKSPVAYLIIGFIAGALFMSCIFFIVSISTMGVRDSLGDEPRTGMPVLDEQALHETSSLTTQEKYIVKKGDTLNGIAYRFYGKYNEAKILEIQKINNITNPASISVGQELVIPVTQER